MFSVSFIRPVVGFSPTLADLSTDDLLAVAKRLAIGGVEEIDPHAISIYFFDATPASAFVARWCAAPKVEAEGGLFRTRDDEPAPRIGAGLHRTP